jgi:hypothetical protein
MAWSPSSRRETWFAATAAVGLAAAGLAGCNAVLGVDRLAAHGAGGALPCEEDCAALAAGACLRGVCNESAGHCVIEPMAEGTACDDGTFCTQADACHDGVCTGTPNDCGMSAPECHAVDCNEKLRACAVVPGNDGAPCSSGADKCLASTCQMGKCTGTQPKVCPPSDACHAGQCVPATGECMQVAANDGQSCTNPQKPCTATTCAQGLCDGTMPKDCSAAADTCNDGTCEAATGKCVKTPANEGAACDFDVCFTAQKCAQGKCTGGTALPVTAYLDEDFAANLAGWQLGEEWQIAAAKASSGQVMPFFPDPAADHSQLGDNGVAGVVIGGNCAKKVHAAAYLTSPAVDVSLASGGLWLSFWRWLESDAPPAMTDTVEVFDGAVWQVVWQSNGVVSDSAWMFQKIDIAKYKNAALAVRFGFAIADANLATVGGWSVDDVRIASLPCPGK